MYRALPLEKLCALVELQTRKVLGLDSYADSYCSAENFVGVKKLLATLSLIWPSFSLFAFTSFHSGSAKNAFHFFSRSASESHLSKYVSSLPQLGPTRVVLIQVSAALRQRGKVRSSGIYERPTRIRLAGCHASPRSSMYAPRIASGGSASCLEWLCILSIRRSSLWMVGLLQVQLDGKYP